MRAAARQEAKPAPVGRSGPHTGCNGPDLGRRLRRTRGRARSEGRRARHNGSRNGLGPAAGCGKCRRPTRRSGVGRIPGKSGPVQDWVSGRMGRSSVSPPEMGIARTIRVRPSPTPCRTGICSWAILRSNHLSPGTLPAGPVRVSGQGRDPALPLYHESAGLVNGGGPNRKQF
jgi:hypothetical protein